MAATFIGTKAIQFGVKDPLPLKGFPVGRIRFRMRAGSFILARVKTSEGIREFYVEEKDGFWMPCYEQGRNATATG